MAPTPEPAASDHHDSRSPPAGKSPPASQSRESASPPSPARPSASASRSTASPRQTQPPPPGPPPPGPYPYPYAHPFFVPHGYPPYDPNLPPPPPNPDGSYPPPPLMYGYPPPPGHPGQPPMHHGTPPPGAMPGMPFWQWPPPPGAFDGRWVMPPPGMAGQPPMGYDPARMPMPKRRRTGEMSDAGSPGEERKAKKKIEVACAFCRERKLRCDGGRPQCGNCALRERECHYQPGPPNRRGPGKKSKNTVAMEAHAKEQAQGRSAAGPSTAGAAVPPARMGEMSLGLPPQMPDQSASGLNITMETPGKKRKEGGGRG